MNPIPMPVRTPPAIGISFAARANLLAPEMVYAFSEPLPLAAWRAPGQEGLYAILLADPTCSPRQFRVIYFGQSKDYSGRGFPNSHHKSPTWAATAQGKPIYVAAHLMPNSTEQQRCEAEKALCAAYNPCCNG